MECIDRRRVSFDIKLDGADNIKRLFAMTPYYWRTSSADAQRLYELESLETKVDVVIAAYKKRDRKENL